MSNRVYFKITGGKGYEAIKADHEKRLEVSKKWEEYLKTLDGYDGNAYYDDCWSDEISLLGIKLKEKPKGWKNTSDKGYYVPCKISKDRKLYDSQPKAPSTRAMLKHIHIQEEIRRGNRLYYTQLYNFEDCIVVAISAANGLPTPPENCEYEEITFSQLLEIDKKGTEQ